MRSILAEYSQVINFTFTEITETATQHADQRFAKSNSPSTAWAYLPTPADIGGDAWFNNATHWYDTPVMGNYAYMAMMHEIGHTMGLKHPQNSSGAFGFMPTDKDSLEYTLMSYKSYTGAPMTALSNEAWGYPQSLMMYDVAALQEMYGANYATNSGDTVYKWDPTTGEEFINGVGQGRPGANRVFMNIWDGGGHDTYDFSNYTTNLKVNLNPGAWTTMSTAQLAALGAGHYADGNISNSLLYHGNVASLIEDVIGGSGNDTIIGNDADNHITGGAGNDYIDGGAGNDTAVYSGVQANYQLVHNADGSWTVTDLRAGSPDGTDTLVNIENLQFKDVIVSLNNVQTLAALQVPTITSFSDDSGVVGDGITNDNTLTFIGTATAGSTVKVYDGATLLGTATATATGTWTYVTAALGDGSHSFTTLATDASGKTTAASAPVNIVIDTVAPNAPTISSFSPDSNVVGDGITSANTLTLTGLAEPGSTVQVYDGGTLMGTAQANSFGAWTFTTYNPTAAAPSLIDADDDVPSTSSVPGAQDAPVGGVSAVLADGVHTFTAKAIDVAGNVSAVSAVLTVKVDTVAPNAPTVAAFSNDTGVVGDGITAANVQTLTGTAEAGSTVNVYDGATLLGKATANVSGAWSFTTATLADGAHAFTAKAVDAAGNVSAASTALNLKVDTVAPNAPTVAAFSNDTGVVGDGITAANVQTLTGTAEAGSTVNVYDGATLLGNATANASGAWSFTTSTLSDGAHAFTAKAVDAAGNVSAASAALSLKVDTVAPNAPTVASFSNDTGVVGDGITAANVQTLTGTAEAGSTVNVYDGATLLGTATANVSGAWSFTTATLADGAHAFTAKATDAAGNISAASAALVSRSTRCP